MEENSPTRNPNNDPPMVLMLFLVSLVIPLPEAVVVFGIVDNLQLVNRELLDRSMTVLVVIQVIAAIIAGAIIDIRSWWRSSHNHCHPCMGGA